MNDMRQGATKLWADFCPTNTTLVCALSNINSYYVSVLGDSDADRREILHDGTAVSLRVRLPFWWRYL